MPALKKMYKSTFSKILTSDSFGLDDIMKMQEEDTERRFSFHISFLNKIIYNHNIDYKKPVHGTYTIGIHTYCTYELPMEPIFYYDYFDMRYKKIKNKEWFMKNIAEREHKLLFK